MEAAAAGGDRLEVLAVVGGSGCRQGGGNGAGRGRQETAQNRAKQGTPRGKKKKDRRRRAPGGDGDSGGSNGRRLKAGRWWWRGAVRGGKKRSRRIGGGGAHGFRGAKAGEKGEGFGFIFFVLFSLFV
uniref:Uncharacterized protein n=1 Tax=Opuntia streptacantha TaxID=393608 RepID=A0A7C9DE15_OPUST